MKKKIKINITDIRLIEQGLDKYLFTICYLHQ